MRISANWFEDFFHGITLDLWRQAIPPEHTEREAEFLIKVLNCAAGSHVLDVPCGNGRLSFALAKRGISVTGVDISKEFIEEAQSLAKNRSDPPVPQFILGDMRSIAGDLLYDGAYCFGNSFGFMKYTDMEKFLSGVARSLKPGARFIINTGMAAESILPDFEEQSSHQVGDISMTVKERYVVAESCIDSEYIFERDGRRESHFAKHWIYTTAEIQRMLERAGFKIIQLFGSLKREPYKLGSQELFVVAENPKSRVQTPTSGD